MTEQYANLFTPISIGKLIIKNRYAMSPVVPMGYCDSEGAFNARGVAYYTERAKGGVGLIFTGVGLVDAFFEGSPIPTTFCPTQNPRAFSLSAYEMTERVHAHDVRIFLQLGAGMGRAGMPFLIKNKVSASPCPNRWSPENQHRAMTVEEIEHMVHQFGASALLAKDTGFDGVEIHAVHEGYLLDQFAISFYNQRTDAYGGCLSNRLRFAVEIVQEIKRVCGSDFPVSLRYSAKSFIKDWRQGAVPGEVFEEKGRDLAEGIDAAQLLVAAGYDALNVDVGTYDSWYWNHPPMYFEDGMYLPYSQLIKQAVDVPVIVSGRMDQPDLASHAIRDGKADIISLGRPLLADPELPAKVRDGRFDDVRPCLSCHEGCQGRVHHKAPISCAVNPACGREESYGIMPATVHKTILIVGGGIAGLEAARVSALRGHQVRLLEKSDALGGNLIPGGVPDFKKDDRRLVTWYRRQLNALGVDVHYHVDATPERVLVQTFDELIIATGSRPVRLSVPNEGNVSVYTADEVLLDPHKAGNHVVIVGAGLVGGELALWLRTHGRQVTLVEATGQILGGPTALPFVNYDMLKDLLNFQKVKILLNSQVTSLIKNGVEIESPTGVQVLVADTVIWAVGYRSERSLYEALSSRVGALHLLGDARRVKNIHYAIWDAYEVARNL
ncbi:MAG: FAD-dependent oxidoreductase [Oscillospiraceae bacterium]